MEDFPLLLLFFIFYLIAGSSKKKKKKQSSAKRQSPMRSRAQGEQRDIRALIRDAQTKRGFEAAFAGQQAEQQPCEEQRIHLHDVTLTQLDQAGEGDDPCHFGGEIMKESICESEMESSEADSSREAFRRDVLRGVIMSEVLIRPHERKALQRSRQRTNGY